MVSLDDLKKLICRIDGLSIVFIDSKTKMPVLLHHLGLNNNGNILGIDGSNICQEAVVVTLPNAVFYETF